MDLVAPPSSAKSAQPAPLMYELIEQAFAFSAALRGWTADLLAELNLTEALADVLWHLDTGDTAASMRHLASLLKCDPSNVTFLVDRLEERGLVERQTDPADRRVKLVGLTTAGVHIRNQIVRQPPPDHHWRNSPPQTSSGCTISWQRQPASQA